MESRFPKRVELERKCLDVVNKSALIAPLVGLSLVTVRRWIYAARLEQPNADWDNIYRTLALAAEASRSEADISDEIFVDISEEEAEHAINQLTLAMRSLDSSHQR
ncbi:hypothetical protein [Xanthomonas campestris]|uniref:hypothetical protein n=1 Tax=Xanthomonas campestris TaxID=339 RepID=UPI001D15D7D2|nr:hypothetical protein [Xanthomonas campestris]MCC3256068.1 hypothetical protein [Xanthomonas campestris pv. armoraciae]